MTTNNTRTTTMVSQPDTLSSPSSSPSTAILDTSEARLPAPPSLVLPSERPDPTMLPQTQTPVDRVQLMQAVINQNFCFVSSALGLTIGGFLGAFEGYKIGKEASLSVLAQKRESIDPVSVSLKHPVVWSIGAWLFGWLSLFYNTKAKQIPKSEALWFVGSTALREVSWRLLLLSNRSSSFSKSIKGAAMKGFRYCSVVTTLSYTEVRTSLHPLVALWAIRSLYNDLSQCSCGSVKRCHHQFLE